MTLTFFSLYCLFQETFQTISFFTPKKNIEYTTNLKELWKVEKEKDNTQKHNATISSLKDVKSDLDFDALICYVSIGGN